MGNTICCASTSTDDIYISEESIYHYSELHRTNTMVSINPGKFVLEKPRSIMSDYTITETIGKGAFGIVYKAIQNSTGKRRAIKKIMKDSDDNNGVDGKLIAEIDILKHLDHPNIMKIYEFSSTDNEYFVVSEYIPGGELFDKIAQRKCFSELDAAYIMKQLLAAISYCHSINIVHRDLKPENILIDSIEGDKITVKIVDFGTALIIRPDTVISKKVGSIYYIAPEILKGNYTSKCDIWSLGVIMYVLLSGTAPFNDRSNKRIADAIMRGKYCFPSPLWDHISSEAKDLISKMLTYDQNKRISASDAYQHPWLNICKVLKLEPSHALESLENIKCFNAKTKLQKAALMFIVSQLMSKQERNKLEDIFLELDKNADGKITQHELIQGYTKLVGEKTIAEQELSQLMDGLNIDRTKEINYSDFLLAAANKTQLLTLKNIKEAFDIFDIDKSGYILPNEIKMILGDRKSVV